MIIDVIKILTGRDFFIDRAILGSPFIVASGGKDMSIKFTILGETGSGKTCYLLGMYYEMSAGIGGYSIIAPNHDDEHELSIRYQRLNEKSLGPERFPLATNKASKYNFNLQYAFETIMPFEWIDYPGNFLDPAQRDVSDEQYKEVEKSINESCTLFICLDGANLVGNNTKQKIKNVREKCSRNITPYLGKRKDEGKQLPPIAIIITKFDLCIDDTDENEIREIVKKSFSPLFGEGAENMMVAIIPVSLGEAIEDDSVKGELEPRNIHIPIFFGIYRALSESIAFYEEKLFSINNNINDWTQKKNEEANRIFLLRDDKLINELTFKISNGQNEDQQIREILNSMKRNLEKVNKELQAIQSLYVDGIWRNWY